jgi:NAD(P)-dependent dehydrogenase (short-subunit alcohol dehydrogenase family)
LADRLGERALFVALDVTQPEQWQSAMQTTLEQFGRLDILVNNAGIAIPGDIEVCTLDDWQRTQSVNSDAVFLGTQAAVKAMKETGGGSIINISSMEGIIGEPNLPAYNASKGAVRIFTKSVAIHCAQQGYNIRVNSVHPGYVMTKLVADAIASLPEDQAQAYQQHALSKVPMGRMSEPKEIAGTIAFLASDDASYMTGSELVVDGGYTAQ